MAYIVYKPHPNLSSELKDPAEVHIDICLGFEIYVREFHRKTQLSFAHPNKPNSGVQNVSLK
jgi:hypothetical protein